MSTNQPVIIACGKAKRDRPAMAKDLYTGNYFRDVHTWANSITPGHNIYIVSAKHGLIPSTRIIAPYDLKMGDPGSVTTHTLTKQAHALDLIGTRPILVAGALYREALQPVFPELTCPFAIFGGMGKQRKALRAHHGKIPETHT